jgi:hypothetical protein
MRPPNPITQGFRVALRNLPVALLEVVWRWSYIVVAALLAFWACRIMLEQLQLADWVLSAWRTQNYRLLALAGLSIVIKPLPSLLPVILELIALAFGLGLLWSLLAASARRITLRRLEPARPPLGFFAMLLVQWLRALFTILGSLLWLASLLTAVYFATKGTHIELGRFYLIVIPAAVVIAIFWLIVNWYLSQAAIFGRKGQGLASALRAARRSVRRHTSDFAGIAFLFFLMRLVLALIGLAIIGLTSSMMATAFASYVKLCVTVVLAYSFIADFLYLARMAAYRALAAQPDPLAAEMGIVDPELPVENSSSR